MKEREEREEEKEKEKRNIGISFIKILSFPSPPLLPSFFTMKSFLSGFQSFAKATLNELRASPQKEQPLTPQQMVVQLDKDWDYIHKTFFRWSSKLIHQANTMDANTSCGRIFFLASCNCEVRERGSFGTKRNWKLECVQEWLQSFDFGSFRIDQNDYNQSKNQFRIDSELNCACDYDFLSLVHFIDPFIDHFYD